MTARERLARAATDYADMVEPRFAVRHGQRGAGTIVALYYAAYHAFMAGVAYAARPARRARRRKAKEGCNA